jgi:hypothetical protein
VELDEGATVDLLVHAGVLQLSAADDHGAIERALQRLIQIMVEDDRARG